MPSQSYPDNLPAGVVRRTHREVRFGAYVLGSTLGEGEFGKVKLGWRKDGKQPSQVAIKLIKRHSIPRGSERESKVHREINALKKLSHPNIVRLEEVLQNDKYVGIVLDYASGGELFDYIFHHKHLKDSMASRLFSQLVSGVDYMHSKLIVHRDLKLENLLLDKHKNIIITDFGFVNSFTDGNELMKTSCGSPCYAAPELVLKNEPYEARKVDVWSCGVILYAMLAGYLPFDDDPDNPEGTNIAKLYNYISSTELTFPEYVQPLPRNLLRNILVPEPKFRYTLRQVRQHSWLAPHAPFLSVTPEEWDRNAQVSKQQQAQLQQQKQLQLQQQQRQKASEKIGAPVSSPATSSPTISTSSKSKKPVNRSTNRYSMVEPTTSSFAIANGGLTTIPAVLSSQRVGPPRSYSTQQVSGQSSSPPNSNGSATLMPPSKSSALIKSLGENATANEQTTHYKTSALHVLQDVVNADNKRNSIYSVSEVANADFNDENVEKVPIKIRNYTKKGVTNSSRNSQKLPTDPSSRPRPSSYHPGLLPDGPLNADFSFMIPKSTEEKKPTVSPIKSEVSSSVSELKERQTPTKKSFPIETTPTKSGPTFASHSVFESIFGNKKNDSPDDKHSSVYSSPPKSAQNNEYELITNGIPPSPLQQPISDKKSKRNSKYGGLGISENTGPKIPRSQSTRLKSDYSTNTTGSTKSDKKRFSLFGSLGSFGNNSYEITDEKLVTNGNGYHKQSKSISFGRRASTVISNRNRSTSNIGVANRNEGGSVSQYGLSSHLKSPPSKARVKSVIITGNNRKGDSATKKVFDFFRRKNTTSGVKA